jgi:HSP20 family protein
MTAPLKPLTEEFSEQLRRQIRRMLVHFDEMQILTPSPGAWMPPTDLREHDDAIHVNVEVPGIPLAHLRVTILDRTLRIEGRKEQQEAKAPNDERPLGFICMERSYGSFMRTINLKWPVDVDGIAAWLDNGILRVRLPKAKAAGQEIVIPITEEK